MAALLRDRSTLPQLTERTGDRFPSRSELGSELLLGAGEPEGGSRVGRVRALRLLEQCVRDPCGHILQGDPVQEGSELPDAPGELPDNGPRHFGPAEKELLNVGEGQEENSPVPHRTRPRERGALIEKRDLAEEFARVVGREHLLPPGAIRAVEPYLALEDQVETATLLSFPEEDLPSPHRPARGSTRERDALRLR